MNLTSKNSFIIVVVTLFEIHLYVCDENIFEYGVESNKTSEPGESLFLTPLIEKGMLSEARNKSRVKPFKGNIESYAGYLTVNKIYNSNLFFWFFKAEDKNWENLPVSLWLQGGPGATSLLALFLENGPYILKDKKLHRRLYSWHKKCNIIYIDNPVGSGFSFTDFDDGYAKNQTIIGEQLYCAVKQFFTLFPSLSKNHFYISGESYAGKYIPTLAYTIHENNIASSLNQQINGSVFINLKGLLIGNGLVDPYNMMKYGDYLYQLGLIDTNTQKRFHDYEKQIKQAILSKKWLDASLLYGKMILHYTYFPYGTLFENVTGFHEHYNYIDGHASGWTSQNTDFVNSNHFRRTVHIGNRLFSNGKKCKEGLAEDMAKSVINLVEQLLNHYRIIFYNGQLDVICAYPLTVNFIKNMKWSSAGEYATAKRHIWKVDNDTAGYYKIAGNVTEVLVRAAGHMVPSDQPLWAYELFNKFIYNKELNDEL